VHTRAALTSRRSDTSLPTQDRVHAIYHGFALVPLRGDLDPAEVLVECDGLDHNRSHETLIDYPSASTHIQRGPFLHACGINRKAVSFGVVQNETSAVSDRFATATSPQSVRIAQAMALTLES